MGKGVRTVGGTVEDRVEPARRATRAGKGPERERSAGPASAPTAGAATAGTATAGTAEAHAEEHETVAEASVPVSSVARRRPRRPRAVMVLAVVAALGLAGTAGFGLAWAGQQGAAQQETQVRQAASQFLTDLTNFNAKTVDADFSAVTAMATGTFAGQADKFFNSAIRQELQTALASSRGQIRDLYVQSISGDKASVYAVVDQLYANNHITAPQADVLRIVVDLAHVGPTWKVADVTVLEGPSSASGSASGSGSTPSTPSTPTPAGTTPAG